MALSHLSITSYLYIKKNYMNNGHWFSKYVILQAVYFKLRFTLSCRNVKGILKIYEVVYDNAISKFNYS